MEGSSAPSATCYRRRACPPCTWACCLLSSAWPLLEQSSMVSMIYSRWRSPHSQHSLENNNSLQRQDCTSLAHSAKLNLNKSSAPPPFLLLFLLLPLLLDLCHLPFAINLLMLITIYLINITYHMSNMWSQACVKWQTGEPAPPSQGPEWEGTRGHIGWGAAGCAAHAAVWCSVWRLC